MKEYKFDYDIIYLEKVMNLNETTKNKPTLHQFGIRKGIVCSSFWGLSAVV